MRLSCSLKKKKEEPLKSADQSISMNLGSTTESSFGSKCVGKYLNMMEQLRDAQYKAQQCAADKFQQLQKAMEQEKNKVELELKKKIKEAQQKIDEE
eukprot:829089-Ditylum_brightwellii.AAC.1